MNITTITLTKQYKKGMPNYSSLLTGMSITWEIKEGEEFDYTKAWNEINQQLSIQGNETEQSWLKTTETKDSYKTVIKTKKEGYAK